jgi:hypothetical protein
VPRKNKMPRKNEKGTKNIQEMMMVMSGLCSVALVSATADAGAGDLGCGLVGADKIGG